MGFKHDTVLTRQDTGQLYPPRSNNLPSALMEVVIVYICRLRPATSELVPDACDHMAASPRVCDPPWLQARHRAAQPRYGSIVPTTIHQPIVVEGGLGGTDNQEKDEK
ncbi:hypothetical protein Tco_1549754 [Tanacetum coccineum]